jgi:hypothetical protein
MCRYVKQCHRPDASASGNANLETHLVPVNSSDDYSHTKYGLIIAVGILVRDMVSETHAQNHSSCWSPMILVLYLEKSETYWRRRTEAEELYIPGKAWTGKCGTDSARSRCGMSS